MNKHIFFAAFAALSLLVGVGCLVRALYLFKTGKRAKRVLSSIQIFIVFLLLRVKFKRCRALQRRVMITLRSLSSKTRTQSVKTSSYAIKKISIAGIIMYNG